MLIGMNILYNLFFFLIHFFNVFVIHGVWHKFRESNLAEITLHYFTLILVLNSLVPDPNLILD